MDKGSGVKVESKVVRIGQDVKLGKTVNSCKGRFLVREIQLLAVIGKLEKANATL